MNEYHPHAIQKRPFAFLFIHGAKDIALADELLDRIRLMKDKPWVFNRHLSDDCLL